MIVGEDITSSDSLENLGVAMLAGGITGGIGGAMGNGPGTVAASAAPKTFTSRVSNAFIDAGARSAAQSAIQGESFSDALETQLVNVAVTVASEYGTEAIGKAYHDPINPIGKPTQLALHGLVGCAAGSVTGNCASGAAGAIAGEIMAQRYVKNEMGELVEQGYATEADFDRIKGTGSNIGELTGALAGAVFSGGDGDGVYAGSRQGRSAAANNATSDLLWSYDNSLREAYPEEAAAMDEVARKQGEVILNTAMFAGGVGAVGIVGRTVVKEGVAMAVKKFGQQAVANEMINGTSGGLAGGWNSLIQGGDVSDIAISSGVGAIAGVAVGSFTPRLSNGYLGASLSSAASGGVGGATGGILTTYFDNPYANLDTYANNGLEGFASGLISGAFMGPIAYAGRLTAPVSANFAASVYGLKIDALTGVLSAKHDIFDIKPNITTQLNR
jgi:hypothetical protein